MGSFGLPRMHIFLLQTTHVIQLKFRIDYEPLSLYTTTIGVERVLLMAK